jgi:polyisoprenoid-binding protein YceI
MRAAVVSAAVLLGVALFNPVHGKDRVPVSQLPPGVYQLDRGHASLTWKVDHLGLSDYTARFATFDAQLTLTPDDLTKSKVEVTVDPASVRTDYPYADQKDFDKKLAIGEEWFNAGTFPQIRFDSTRVEMTGDDTFRLYGDLTLLGVTKPVALQARLNGAYRSKPFSDVPALGFSATGSIRRSEWGLDAYLPGIGDEVDLLVEVEFQRDE